MRKLFAFFVMAAMAMLLGFVEAPPGKVKPPEVPSLMQPVPAPDALVTPLASVPAHQGYPSWLYSPRLCPGYEQSASHAQPLQIYPVCFESNGYLLNITFKLPGRDVTPNRTGGWPIGRNGDRISTEGGNTSYRYHSIGFS